MSGYKQNVTNKACTTHLQEKLNKTKQIPTNYSATATCNFFGALGCRFFLLLLGLIKGPNLRDKTSLQSEDHLLDFGRRATPGGVLVSFFDRTELFFSLKKHHLLT